MEAQQDSPGNNFNELFFFQPRNTLKERWTGRCPGVEGVQEKLDIQQVFNREHFRHYTLDLEQFDKVIYTFPLNNSTVEFEVNDIAGLVKSFERKAGLTKEQEHRSTLFNNVPSWQYSNLPEIKGYVGSGISPTAVCFATGISLIFWHRRIVSNLRRQKIRPLRKQPED